MKWIIFFQILFLFTSCCKDSESNCASDEISYGDINCIKKDDYTFYETEVDFYCLNVSLLFGLDIDNMLIKPYYINTLNPINDNLMGSVGKINYSSNLFYLGFNVECNINDQYKVTWVIIEDKTQFETYPSSIKVKLLLKESVDFNSTTLDEMEIELIKRE
jgi:hypothetical protein